MIAEITEAALTTAAQLPFDLDGVTPAAPTGEVASKINTLLSWGMWLALVAGVLGLIIAGVMMSVGRRNRSQMAADGAIGIPWVLGGISIVVLAVPIVNMIS